MITNRNRPTLFTLGLRVLTRTPNPLHREPRSGDLFSVCLQNRIDLFFNPCFVLGSGQFWISRDFSAFSGIVGFHSLRLLVCLFQFGVLDRRCWAFVRASSLVTDCSPLFESASVSWDFAVVSLLGGFCRRILFWCPCLRVRSSSGGTGLDLLLVGFLAEILLVAQQRGDLIPLWFACSISRSSICSGIVASIICLVLYATDLV